MQPTLDLGDARQIAIALNLIVCLCVTAFGTYWLKTIGEKWKDEARFLYRAYLYWWFSWAVWCVFWMFRFTTVSSSNNTSEHGELISIILSDINSLLLLLAYVAITRANRFTIENALMLLIQIVTILALVYTVMHTILILSNAEDFALAAHEMTALCFAIASPGLLGWACKLRYGSSAALYIGLLYGAIQPLAFVASFDLLYESLKGDIHNEVLISVLTILALLKIIWATTFTKIILEKPKNLKPIVLEAPNQKINLWANWSSVFKGQFALLCIFFILCLFWMLHEFIEATAAWVGLILSIISLVTAALVALGKLGKK